MGSRPVELFAEHLLTRVRPCDFVSSIAECGDQFLRVLAREFDCGRAVQERHAGSKARACMACQALCNAVERAGLACLRIRWRPLHRVPSMWLPTKCAAAVLDLSSNFPSHRRQLTDANNLRLSGPCFDFLSDGSSEHRSRKR